MNSQFEVPMKYKYVTRVGNWSEEMELEQDKMKDYLKKKENQSLDIIREQSKLIHSQQKASLTYSKDGYIHFGDHVMLFNNRIKTYAAINIWERIMNSTNESYSVTSTAKIIPCNRSVFIIKKVEQDKYQDDIVRYGQKVHIVAHPRLLKNKNLYLTSGHITPLRCAKFTRKQEVSVTVNESFENAWIFEHPDPKLRYQMIGQPVEANQTLLINHFFTNQWLATEDVSFRNDFGVENEVLVHSYQTVNKTRNLQAEKTGRATVENTMRNQHDQNSWEIRTAQDLSEEFDESTQEQQMTFENVMAKIRNVVFKKGYYGVRRLNQIFYQLDEQQEYELSIQKILQAFESHGVEFSNQEFNILVQQFDRNQSGYISYKQLIDAIRGPQNGKRLQAIQDVYQHLMIGKQQINLEQVAQAFDSSKHPEALRKFKSNQQAFKEFLDHWNNKSSNAIVTFDDFQEYFMDVSASVERDDVFVFMITSCFKK